jgi:hypothetical protein
MSAYHSNKDLDLGHWPHWLPEPPDPDEIVGGLAILLLIILAIIIL